VGECAPGIVRRVLLILCVAVGGLAGLATPLLAAGAGRWRWVGIGAAAGAAVGAGPAAAGPVPSVAWLVVLAVGVPLAAIDLDRRRLPDLLVLPALVLLGGLAAVAGEGRALLAGVATFAVYAVLAVLPRGGLGFGDVKLAGVLGLALGLLGWGAVVRGTALAFTIGGVAALALLVTGRARRDTQLPFGPCLLAGALLGASPVGPAP